MCHISSSRAPSNCGASRTELLPWFFFLVSVFYFFPVWCCYEFQVIVSLMLWNDWKHLFLQLCPGRSWRALSPAASWATSSCPSPETIRTERTARADTSRTTWSSRAATSPTSCSNRRGASASAGETDAGVIVVIAAWNVFHSVPGTHVLLSMKGTRFLPLFLLAAADSPPPTVFFSCDCNLSIPSSRNSLYFSVLFCLCEGNVPTRLIIQSLDLALPLFILPWLTLMFGFLEWLKENKTHHAERISILCRL